MSKKICSSTVHKCKKIGTSPTPTSEWLHCGVCKKELCRTGEMNLMNSGFKKGFHFSKK